MSSLVMDCVLLLFGLHLGWCLWLICRFRRFVFIMRRILATNNSGIESAKSIWRHADEQYDNRIDARQHDLDLLFLASLLILQLDADALVSLPAVASGVESRRYQGGRSNEPGIGYCSFDSIVC
jgi:hypothetical protein